MEFSPPEYRRRKAARGYHEPSEEPRSGDPGPEVAIGEYLDEPSEAGDEAIAAEGGDAHPPIDVGEPPNDGEESEIRAAAEESAARGFSFHHKQADLVRRADQEPSEEIARRFIDRALELAVDWIDATVGDLSAIQASRSYGDRPRALADYHGLDWSELLARCELADDVGAQQAVRDISEALARIETINPETSRR